MDAMKNMSLYCFFSNIDSSSSGQSLMNISNLVQEPGLDYQLDTLGTAPSAYEKVLGSKNLIWLK
jgi:hypothetical protein